jgi:Protein of unknown function (DUF4435)
MSSIKQFITGEGLATTLVMVRSGQAVRRAVLLVEGDKDRRVLRTSLGQFVDLVPGDGKPVILEAVERLKDEVLMSWLVVVLDADFDRLLGVDHPEVVLLTDAHDIDCEYFRTPALGKVISEFCSDQKCKRHFGKAHTDDLESVVQAIRQSVVRTGRIIGLLRLLSQREQWRIAFKKLDHTKIVSKDAFDIDVDALIRTVMAAGAAEGTTAERVRQRLAEEMGETYDQWQLCQGHDLTNLLAIGVRKFWGRGSVGAEEVERGLRLAYEQAFFWQSLLGQAIKLRLEQMDVPRPKTMVSPGQSDKGKHSTR